MPNIPDHRPLRYGLAVLFVVLALIVRWLVDPYLGNQVPFGAFLLVVIFSSRFLGFGPSILVIILGGLLASYFFVQPRGSLLISSLESQIGTGFYFVLGSAVAVLSETMRRDQRHLARSVQAERAQRERLRITLSSIGDAVIATDSAGRITSLNPVAELLTGWTDASAAGKQLEEVFHIVHETTREPVENPVHRVLHEGIAVRPANDTILVAQDGRARPIQNSVAPIRNTAGRIIGVVLIFRDVTDQRRAERELRDADRRKNEFLAMLGHELRNPLAPIRNAMVLLGMDNVDAETAHDARDIINRQVDHMVRLVDDLLDVSRIMQGKIELRTEAVEIRAIAERAVESVRPIIDEQRHTLSISVPPEPIWVNADLIRMAQVLSNLINNAAKYTEPGGKIAFEVARVQDGVRIGVRDNGIGIDQDLLPKVFDLFTQADRSIERSQGGLGIGLTLVRNLVEMHGGVVAVHSAGPGQGAEFTVSLPTIALQKPVVAEQWQPVATRPLRVLVVEDMVGSAKILATMLKKFWRHEVALAHDGLVAVDVARSFRPEIVLLDVGLPGISGYEVARRLREQPDTKDALIVALTGYGTSEDRRHALDAGFDEHLVKPASVDSLQKLFTHPRVV